MSEYQYYEFRAVDQPLTPDQMAEMRALSTRAVITPAGFCNTYHYGDFRGSPRKLMQTFFDAHVYVSNFGVCTFMLRLPRPVVPGDTLALYATDEALDWWTAEENTIVEWQTNDEPTGDWMEGEGWLDRLLPLRDELARGDYRSLYIGWLSSIGSGSKASSYEKACTLLVDLRDAYAQAGRRPEFEEEFGRFVAQTSRRTALMRRLKQAGLVIEPPAERKS